MPLSEAKARLSEIAEEVQRTHERVHITRNGRSYVVLLAAEDLESLEATLELLADAVAMERVRESERAVASGDVTTAEEMAPRGKSDAGVSGPVPDDQPFTVVLAPAPRRALIETLPSAAAFAAWGFITGELVRRPHAVGVPLRKPFPGQWRARRGEYRVRYLIDESRREVQVLDVDHRRDIYRL